MNEIITTEEYTNTAISKTEKKFYPDMYECANVAQSIDSKKLDTILALNSPKKEHEFVRYCIELGGKLNA